GLPKTLPPKSSMAICTAATEPGPSAPDEGPDMSVRTPIFTTSSETCALAGSVAAIDNAASATSHKRCMRSSLDGALSCAGVLVVTFTVSEHGSGSAGSAPMLIDL